MANIKVTDPENGKDGQFIVKLRLVREVDLKTLLEYIK